MYSLILTVIPLSYWVIREFNRRILREPSDKKLQQLKRINQLHLTKNVSDVEYLCPSALYVEVALLTADGRVCIGKSKRNFWIPFVPKNIPAFLNRLKILFCQ